MVGNRQWQGQLSVARDIKFCWIIKLYWYIFNLFCFVLNEKKVRKHLNQCSSLGFLIVIKNQINNDSCQHKCSLSATSEHYLRVTDLRVVISSRCIVCGLGQQNHSRRWWGSVGCRCPGSSKEFLCSITSALTLSRDSPSHGEHIWILLAAQYLVGVRNQQNANQFLPRSWQVFFMCSCLAGIRLKVPIHFLYFPNLKPWHKPMVQPALPLNIWDWFSSFNIESNSDIVYQGGNNKKKSLGGEKGNYHTSNKYNAVSFSLLHESKIFFQQLLSTYNWLWNNSN